MLRQRAILFLVLTTVLIGGVLLIYGQRTGRLTIFGAVPSIPAKLVVNTPIDLQKGVTAGNGNTELVDNTIQLKKGSQFSTWTKEESTTPDFLQALPEGDLRRYPLTTSFNENTKKFFVSSFNHLYSYDPQDKSWQVINSNIGQWASWSNKLNRLIAIERTGNLNPASNIISLNALGGESQMIGSQLQFRAESTDAVYHDPISDTIVSFRQIDAFATQATDDLDTAPAGICSTGLEVSNCDPANEQFVEWFDIGSGQDNQFRPQGEVAWPEPRVGASVAYDPVKKEILVLGGFTVSPNFSTGPSGQPTFSYYSYAPASVLWAFDTNTKSWVQRIGSNQPPGRAFSKMVYDQKNKRFIVFGGLTGLTKTPSLIAGQSQTNYTASNDFWSYDPANNVWQQIDIPNGPETRFSHGIGYNSIDQELVIFSGQKAVTMSPKTADQILPPKITDTWTARSNGYAQTNTCQFDVGSPQIQQMFRYQAIKNADLPAGTSVTVSFAPSTDGVSFGQFSTPITYTQSKDVLDSIDLAQILPENTRFVRILCSLSTSGTATPSFDGFTIDYEALGTATPAFTLEPQVGQAPLTVTATRTDATTNTCTIDFGDNTPPMELTTSQSINHLYQNTGTLTATMTCGSQVSTQTITITNEPSANVTLNLSKTSYVPGETVDFTLQNLGPASITLDDSLPFIIKQATDSQDVFDPTGQATPITLTTDQKQSWTWDQKNQASTQVAQGIYSLTIPYTVGDGIVNSKTVALTIAASSQPDSPTAKQLPSITLATSTKSMMPATLAQANQPEALAFSLAPTEGVAPLDITAIYTGLATGLVWDFGDGTIETVAQGPSTKQHTYQLAGTYTITLRSGTAVGSQTVLVSSGKSTGNTGTPILVNGSIAGTNTKSTGNVPVPQTLIATGTNPIAVSLLIALLIASGIILTQQLKRTHK